MLLGHGDCGRILSGCGTVPALRLHLQAQIPLRMATQSDAVLLSPQCMPPIRMTCHAGATSLFAFLTLTKHATPEPESQI